MRLIQSLPVVFLLALAPAGAVPCVVSATSVPLLSGGLAEPLGTMTLQCSGAAANALLQGYLFITVQGTITNHEDAGKNLLGLTVANANTGAPVPLAGFTITQTSPGGITLYGISTNFDGQGRLTLLVSGLRSAAAPHVMAGLGFIALPSPPALDIPAGLVEVGHTVDAVLSSTPDAAFQPNSGGVKGVNLAPTIASMAPNLTVRVTEAAASAFHARLAADDTGTRFRLQFAELPAGSRIFAPDAVAGNDATAPTGSGLLLQLLQAGTYTPGAGSLLLVRVTGAAPDGTGGTLAWTSVAGANQLSVATIREADVTSAGEAYMIYEVADSNAANVESAELPLYAFAGPTNSNGVFPAHATLDIVPNATESAAAAASVPRYQAPIAVGPDCLALGDCQAHYFPSLKVATYNTNPHFTLQFGSRRISGLLGVGNLGRGVATWQASVEYNSKLGKNQSSWIQLPTTSGFTQTSNSFIFNIDPSQLSAGQYGGRIIFTQTNAPDGSQPQFNQAIQLTVLPSLSQKQ